MPAADSPGVTRCCCGRYHQRLAAEGIRGNDADVPHLRRLDPNTVSRNVLLQLGRMPSAALAAARAVAVLGTQRPAPPGSPGSRGWTATSVPKRSGR